ncbi:class I SAM-dependent methyltransferase [Dermacoccus nishinomiyaensis]|uniref:class I SAM-dependent methyltransferase n=1 Tax=Dermacoccus nishinomiyaensis TaxID=1274 RepID=UPI00093F9C4B|nr:hypothetical protein [Dermacoccus nishinomiyaensis]MCT1603686.1 class I SAM-dependent methyltransferase [Dermacoccus nishinomiyaensis]
MTIDLENTGHMRLDRGAMQHWSDLREQPVFASAAVRRVVADVVDEGDQVLVIGPTAMDLVTELAERAGQLTLVTRSIPDAAAYAEALVNRDDVVVVCGDLMHLAEPVGQFDVVLVLEDVARVPSLEDVTPTWAQVVDAVRQCVAPSGRLVLAVENELGLHRITSLRSRYTSNDNGAWDVIATFDASRPRTRRALSACFGEDTIIAISDLFPTWDEPTLVVWNGEAASDAGLTVLSALTMSSPALRRLGADPSRVTRAAVLAGRVIDLPSGWLVVTGRDVTPRQEMTVLASTSSAQAVEYRDLGDEVVTEDGHRLAVDAGAELFGEKALDACASGDSARFRQLVQRWHAFARTQEMAGLSTHGDLRFDNILDAGTSLFAVQTGEAPSFEDAAWRAIVDFVETIRARGSRHLWPAAIDDRTMASTIGAMAGLEPAAALDELIVERRTGLDLPAHDVSGLLAVVDRLQEKNKALASRADWYEARLNMRERELRGRAQRQAAELALARRQQEILRKSAEDVRRSLTYRLGNVALGPLKGVKRRVMK